MSKVLLLLPAVLTLSAPPASGQASHWWKDPRLTRRLELTVDQGAAIDRIYGSTLAERRDLRLQLDRADARLQEALARGDLRDAAAERLINEVEDLRARRNIARTSMLVRIYRVLTPEQRRALAALESDRVQP